MTPQIDEYPSVQRYAALTVQLHALNAANVDAPESLYDELDAAWRGATSAEAERVGGLSEDLYGVEEGLKSVAMDAPARADWNRAVRGAFDAKAIDELLPLLRRAPNDLPPEDVYVIQGWCWDELGCPETAAVFYEAAARRDVRCLRPLYSALKRAGVAADDVDRIADRLFAAHGPTFVREINRLLTAPDAGGASPDGISDDFRGKVQGWSVAA